MNVRVRRRNKVNERTTRLAAFAFLSISFSRCSTRCRTLNHNDYRRRGKYSGTSMLLVVSLMVQTRRIGQRRVERARFTNGAERGGYIRDNVGEQRIVANIPWYPAGPGYPVREAVSTGRQEGRKSLGCMAHKDCRTTRYQITCKFNTLTVRSVQSVSKTIVARWFTALQIRAGGSPRETLRRGYRVPDN